MSEDTTNVLDVQEEPQSPAIKTASPERKETVDVFQREYVEELRRENAKYRKAMQEYKSKAEKLEPVETELTKVKDAYKTIENQFKEQYLAKIPEEKRDKFKELSLEILQMISEEFDVQILKTPGSDGTKPILDKPIMERSQDEWYKLKTTNPQQYTQDMNELIKLSKK